MPHIPIPEHIPGIRGLFHIRPETAEPLIALGQALLWAPNSLTRGERELIAARVSRLNDCTFCYRSHAAIAACHLDDENLPEMVAGDPESAPVTPKLKALLAIADAVQQSGRAVTADHVVRARREGATDAEIHDTVLIAAAFCMFNRYVDGLGAWTPADPEGYRQRARLVAECGYTATPQAAAAR